MTRLLLRAWFRTIGLFSRDRSGLTRPCDGNCGSNEFHTAHLRPGALAYLRSA